MNGGSSMAARFDRTFLQYLYYTKIVQHSWYFQHRPTAFLIRTTNYPLSTLHVIVSPAILHVTQGIRCVTILVMAWDDLLDFCESRPSASPRQTHFHRPFFCRLPIIALLVLASRIPVLLFQRIWSPMSSRRIVVFSY